MISDQLFHLFLNYLFDSQAINGNIEAEAEFVDGETIKEGYLCRF